MWTADKVSELNLDMSIYNSLPTYEAKRDYVLLTALKQQGGFAIDVQFVCLKPLDTLASRYSFIASLHPPMPWSKVPIASLEFIGASKDSVVVDNLLKKLISYYSDDSYRQQINQFTTASDLNDNSFAEYSHLILGDTLTELCESK